MHVHKHSHKHAHHAVLAGQGGSTSRGVLPEPMPGSVLFYLFTETAKKELVWQACFTSPPSGKARAQLDASCISQRLVLAVATNIQGKGVNCEADLVWACNLEATPRTCSSKTKVPCYAFQSLPLAANGVGSAATLPVGSSTVVYNFIEALASDIPHLSKDISWVRLAVGSPDNLRTAQTFVDNVKACTASDKPASDKETAQADLDKLWASRLASLMSPAVTRFNNIQTAMDTANAYANLVCEGIPVDAESQAEMEKMTNQLQANLVARRDAKIDAAIAIGSKCLSVLCSALLVCVDLGAPGMGSSVNGAVKVMQQWNNVIPGANQAAAATSAAVKASVGIGIVNTKAVDAVAASATAAAVAARPAVTGVVSTQVLPAVANAVASGVAGESAEAVMAANRLKLSAANARSAWNWKTTAAKVTVAACPDGADSSVLDESNKAGCSTMVKNIRAAGSDIFWEVSKSTFFTLASFIPVIGPFMSLAKSVFDLGEKIWAVWKTMSGSEYFYLKKDPLLRQSLRSRDCLLLLFETFDLEQTVSFDFRVGDTNEFSLKGIADAVEATYQPLIKALDINKLLKGTMYKRRLRPLPETAIETADEHELHVLMRLHNGHYRGGASWTPQYTLPLKFGPGDSALTTTELSAFEKTRPSAYTELIKGVQTLVDN